MKIVSYNVNGIRAAIKKGLIDWLTEYPVDVFCVQETKANQEDVDLTLFTALGYHVSWYSAQKKGYSGVAIFSKTKPDKVTFGNGYHLSDFEGRVVRVDMGDLTIVNAYFPSGTSGEERQSYKYQWLDEMHLWLQQLRKERPRMDRDSHHDDDELEVESEGDLKEVVGVAADEAQKSFATTTGSDGGWRANAMNSSDPREQSW